MKVRRGQIDTGTGGGGGVILFSTLGLTTGDPFTVLSGVTVRLDVDTPSLGYTDISGRVEKDASFRKLTTTGININNGGVLELGTAATPASWEISLTGAYAPLVNTTINAFTTPTSPNNGASRGILVQPGGTLRLYGTVPAVFWTKLNANATAGATALTTAVATGWVTGDNIIVANTEFPLIANWPDPNRFRTTEGPFVLGASPTSGTTLTLPSGLAWAKWGSMQYPVDVLVSGSGMALTQNTFSAFKASATVPTELDERARIANLTRGGLISCPSDTDWSVKGHGVHIMAMAVAGLVPVIELQGFTIQRCGQRGAIGRYPIHFHMGSYTIGSGTFTQDLSACFVRKVVVRDSENRAYTVHGTCGVEISDCISFNIKGHAYFFEDGSERRVKLWRNMAFKTREPATVDTGGVGTSLPAGFVGISGNGTTTTVTWTGHGLYSGEAITIAGAVNGAFNKFRTPCTVTDSSHFTYASSGSGSTSGMAITHNNDHIKAHDFGSSGFWITNMDNYIVDNYSSDAFSGDTLYSDFISVGFWCSLHSSPTGLSAPVTGCNPSTLEVLQWEGNEAHSCYGRGLTIANAVGDEAGTPGTGAAKYTPNTGGVALVRNKLWKNSRGAYFNSVGVTRYEEWTTADNGEIDFVGSTNNGGTSNNHLLIGFSLNNAVPTPPPPTYPRAGFIPYHGTINFQLCTFVNFPYSIIQFSGDAWDKGFGGGANSGGTDTYDAPGIDLTNGYNTGHKYINSHPGDVATPLDLDGRDNDVPGRVRHHSIAGAYQDVDGKYGTAGKFVLPFSRTTGGAAYLPVDDRYLVGATNLADGPTTGTVVCKTTDTRYFGSGNSDTAQLSYDGQVALGGGAQSPYTITRQNVATGATIGTPQVIKDALNPSVSSFTGYRGFCFQNGARYRLQFTDGAVTVSPPSNWLFVPIVNGNQAGDFVILGLPWANGTVPRICMGNSFSLEGGWFANGPDVAAGRAKLVNNPVGSIALVAADTSGVSYFRDTTNNVVWVRYTATFTAHAVTQGFPFNYDVQWVVIKV